MHPGTLHNLIVTLVAASGMVSATALAEAPPVREPYWSAGAGVGSYWFLPSFRLTARFALHDVSFEARWGLFIPSFATGDVLYEVSAGPRFHVLQREKVVGFFSPHIGFWDIGPKPEDDDEPALTPTAVNGAPRPLNPMVTMVVGADYFIGKAWVLSTEIGGGVVWGQRFNPEMGGVGLVDLNVQFARMF